MNYQNESDLQADGFALTPQVFHGGNGNGKIYEKIVHEVDQLPTRVYFSVDVDGTVAPFNGSVTPAEITNTPVADVPVPTPSETPAEITNTPVADVPVPTPSETPADAEPDVAAQAAD
jgi:hypothetical protein